MISSKISVIKYLVIQTVFNQRIVNVIISLKSTGLVDSYNDNNQGYRTLNEFGCFATITPGVIFHNTLASSDYGYLQHGTFDPRPSYFAVVLWNQLMGETVYDSGEEIREGAHVFAHSRKDGKEGIAYLVINNSKTETTTVELPKEAAVYRLNGNGDMRSPVMYLNGKALVLGENDELPVMEGEITPAGTMEIAPGTCVFITI